MMPPADRLSSDKLAIFLFHGVVRRSKYGLRNYTRKHLNCDFFYSLLKELKHKGYPFSMNDVVRYHTNSEEYPPYSFAITFDDGFENNFSVAAPMLKDLGIAATFYVTTGFIDNNDMSWIDRIEYCLEIASEGALRLPWREKVFPFATTTDKIALLEELRFRTKREPSIDTENLVDDIFAQCKVRKIRQSNDPLDLKMSWDQVATLNNDENFTVGGHTHRHQILTFLDKNELEMEIKTSLDLLNIKADIRTHHYSYPEGASHCFSDQVVTALMDHNIVCCPTAIDGVNDSSDDLFHLKRITVS